MCNKGFLKRILPFAATFAIGLFIASFFVSVGLPRLGERGPGRRWQEMKRLRMENEDLRSENQRLRMQMQSSHWHNAPIIDGDFDVPPVPLMPEAPPPPPRAPRR